MNCQVAEPFWCIQNRKAMYFLGISHNDYTQSYGSSGVLWDAEGFNSLLEKMLGKRVDREVGFIVV